MKRAPIVLGALAGLQALLLALGVTPASASESQGFVGGGGAVTDDWGDEGTLSQTRNADTGATELWQWVLYADGAKKGNGSAFAEGDIDGEFGPNTAAATRNWQSRHNVGVDGVVGLQTFGAADGHLKVAIDEGSGDLYVNYFGSANTIIYERRDGVYFTFVPFDPTHGAERVRANYLPLCIINGTCF